MHIAAPGQNVISTLPGNAYGFMTGTSQATAFVTGGAALVLSHQAGFKYTDVRKYILSTGDALESLTGKTQSSRKLNLYKALTILDQDLTASGVRATNSGQVKVLSEQIENSGLGATAQFGKSLIEALQKAEEEDSSRVRKDRLGLNPGSP